MVTVNKRNKSQFTTIGESDGETSDGLTNASFPSLFLDKMHSDANLYYIIYILNRIVNGSFM